MTILLSTSEQKVNIASIESKIINEFTRKMTVKGVSPGKIIISGEHSVVYGMPALVSAIALYTEVEFHPISRSKSLRLALKGIASGRSIPVNMLSAFKSKLDQRFERFREGDLPVNNILQRPDDLVLYTLAQVVNRLPVMGSSFSKGLLRPGHLTTKSQLPLGAGMGSSAAIIAATIVLYEYLLGKSQSLEERFQLIRFCERLQHGNGSALDASAVTLGGVQFLENYQPNAIDAELNNWYWILSGIPESSTGACVAHVREKHHADKQLWQSFADVTLAITDALQQNSSIHNAIVENQRLLKYIGVVPDRTQAIIDDLAEIGASAKISGAGSITGDKGGIVLLYCTDVQKIQNFMDEKYPMLKWGRLELATEGAYCR